MKRGRNRKAMRQAARSGKQRCPICLVPKLLVLHHINGRDIPQWNASWNEVYICASCHDEVHSGKVIVRGYLMTTGGKVLDHHRTDGQARKGTGGEELNNQP